MTGLSEAAPSDWVLEGQGLEGQGREGRGLASPPDVALVAAWRVSAETAAGAAAERGGRGVRAAVRRREDGAGAGVEAGVTPQVPHAAAVRTRGAGPCGDDGSVLLLVIGLAGVLAALAVLVADVSVVLLAQRGVASAADGAAVAAAQRLDEDVLYDRGLGARVPLDPEQVQDAVRDYAVQVQPRTLLRGHTPDGVTVVVRAERSVPLPFGRHLGVRRVTVRAVARATSPVLAG
ncbi:MAG: hypothetical protein M3P93_02875 [Actinomycetota bacterium]|nr:hypothetical protein [Actinomycetota bacterium]